MTGDAYITSSRRNRLGKKTPWVLVVKRRALERCVGYVVPGSKWQLSYYSCSDELIFRPAHRLSSNVVTATLENEYSYRFHLRKAAVKLGIELPRNVKDLPISKLSIEEDGWSVDLRPEPEEDLVDNVPASSTSKAVHVQGGSVRVGVSVLEALRRQAKKEGMSASKLADRLIWEGLDQGVKT